MCFECRLKRRLCFHNEQHLYKRKCDFSGKEIVSMYKPNAPVTVYDCDVWYSDKWDPLSYGKEFDFNRPFFEQFHELLNTVPQLALSVIKDYNINSDFTNNNWKLKNCYLITDAEEAENCYYGKGVEFDRDCMDILSVFESELCYECVHCRKCYGLRYCQFSTNCSDSWFLRDCNGCKQCFGCCNMHQKRYCIFNEQKTKEEYEEFMRSFSSCKQSEMQKMKKKSYELFEAQPVRAVRGTQNINCSGDNLSNSKDSHYCFDSKDLQDCRYLTRCTGGLKDSMNIHIWGSDGTELCYDGVVVGAHAQRILFSYFVGQQCSDAMYSMYCTRGCSNLFGCIGLRRKDHCVLNKQYSAEGYEELITKIIDHMQKTGEWGQYFPSELSPFGYNETDAQELFPLSQDDAKKQGWKWNMYEAPVEADKTIPASKLPDDMNDVPDDVLNWAIKCEFTGKPYKLTKQELEFYRTHQLPIARRHPLQRHFDRFTFKNSYKLWERTCAKCNKPTLTSYPPERPETLFCEECYRKSVY